MVVSVWENPGCNICGRQAQKLLYIQPSPGGKYHQRQRNNQMHEREGRLTKKLAEHNYPDWLKEWVTRYLKIGLFYVLMIFPVHVSYD